MLKQKAYTIAELLVTVAVISIISAVIFPVISNAKAKASQAACISNMHQIAQGCLLYELDNGGFPEGRIAPGITTHWKTLAFEYIKRDLSCPNYRSNGSLSPIGSSIFGGYAQNSCLFGKEKITNDSQVVLLAEIADLSISYLKNTSMSVDRSSLVGPDCYDIYDYYASKGHVPLLPFGSLRHNEGGNYVFVDGHVKWYRPTDFLLPKLGFGCQLSAGLVSKNINQPRFATILTEP